MSTYHVFVLFSLVSFVVPEQCRNKCNINEVPTDDCTKCMCRMGYFRIFNECMKCKPNCPRHFITVNLCQENADLVCGPCPKGNFYKSSACYNCTKCQHGVLEDCDVDSDTKCLEVVTLNTTSTVIKYRGHKENNIYKYICWISVAFIVLLLIVIVFLVRRQSSTMFYQPPVDTSTESALNFLLKTGVQHCNGNFELTEEELGRYIRVLPCTYAEELAKLLNPDSFNNWTSLAGVLNFNQTDIANWKNDKNAQFTQKVLYRWSFTNTATVGALLNALRKIERHDAISTLCVFIMKQREDVEDSVVLPLDEVSLTTSMSSCIVEVAETCV